MCLGNSKTEPSVPLLASLIAVLLFATFRAEAQAPPPDKSLLHNPVEVVQALRACFRPPAPYPGMRMTLRMSFNAAGELLGEPRVTYVTPEAPAQVQTAYRIALVSSVKECAPSRFSAELGAAIAGRPYYIRFIEHRSRL
jgi:hypothetical protein